MKNVNKFHLALLEEGFGLEAYRSQLKNKTKKRRQRNGSSNTAILAQAEPFPSAEGRVHLPHELPTLVCMQGPD